MLLFEKLMKRREVVTKRRVVEVGREERVEPMVMMKGKIPSSGNTSL